MAQPARHVRGSRRGRVRSGARTGDRHRDRADGPPASDCAARRLTATAARPQHRAPRARPGPAAEISLTDGLALATRGLQKRYGSRTALARLDLSVPSRVLYGF